MPHTGRRRAGRAALIPLAVLASIVAVAVSGCSDPASSTAEGSAPPRVTSTTTHVPSATPTTSPAAAGFDRSAIYAACDAAVPADTWGGQNPLPPGPIVDDSFGPAASDGYTAEHTNGDPNALYINVQYFGGDSFAFSALCVASGDPAAPKVEFIRTLD